MEVLKNPNHRVRKAIDEETANGHQPFVWAFNLQVPSKDNFSAIAYFVTSEPLDNGSLVDRFLKGDDAFRNSRLKLIANIVKGPWLVRAAVGEQAICILGKAVSCKYILGPNYIEVDVDIGSSIVANAIVHLAFGYVTTLTVDLAFLIESQAESELPERILGAVRFSELNPASAGLYEVPSEETIGNLQSSLSTRLWRSFGQGFSNLLHSSNEDESDSSLCNVNGNLHGEDGGGSMNCPPLSFPAGERRRERKLESSDNGVVFFLGPDLVVVDPRLRPPPTLRPRLRRQRPPPHHSPPRTPPRLLRPPRIQRHLLLRRLSSSLPLSFTTLRSLDLLHFLFPSPSLAAAYAAVAVHLAAADAAADFSGTVADLFGARVAALERCPAAAGLLSDRLRAAGKEMAAAVADPKLRARIMERRDEIRGEALEAIRVLVAEQREAMGPPFLEVAAQVVMGENRALMRERSPLRNEIGESSVALS
ncbi:Protein ENHANCED DISEASE RESISTANCE 2-like [Ananas comosus]|uniref:Protein ENHANCED DISEASE RESISTANCE 2-like n=1 Tax=Ananas comosus TaxID=4615 RepID=A0A199VPH3_ANACO|nr:Protein ENHANCED DISEASE RESISTANCE 2-like [Ananas comosus]